MRFYDLFLLSTRMFKARTSRTFLTILGMSVGISAIIFLVSLGYGLQKTVLERITTSDSLLTLDITSDRASSSILDRETLEKIKQTDGVTEISPNFQINAQAKFEDLKTDVLVTATTPSYFRLSGIKPAEGKILSDNDQEGIVISSSVAQIFNKDIADMIGKEIKFVFSVPVDSADSGAGANDQEENVRKVESDKTYKIIGSIAGEGNGIYMNYSSLDNLDLARFNQVKVRCSSNTTMATVREKITGMGFLVSSISETVDQANKVFNVIKIVLMIFGIIALVVSAIGMFNTMTITLLERTEEIGIMKSIGASDMTISLVFVLESTIMGFLGGLGGVLIGWFEGWLFNMAVNLLATHFGGEKVNLFYSPVWFVSVTIIFAAIVGFVTGVIPARRAARTDPLEALRYK
ncbi:MAG: ABC transporter permease [Parcubacteria group bacterium]|jgi:ABC-type antimicrobial peptide transport system permease subunit